MGQGATVPWEAFDVTHPDHNEWAERTGRCLASDCTEHHPRKETHMLVSEDGTVTGSVDVSKLDEVEPKTDEAKAQVENLKAEVNVGREQVARDEERLAELSRRQNPQLRTDEQRSEAEKAGRESSQRQQQEADRLAAEQQKAEQQRQQSASASNDEAELARLQAEAEAAGVTVDKRWGPDRLRQETEQAKASKSPQKKG